jgi:hypothetical protein
VLLGQGYRTLRGAVIDDYGAMVEWWLTGKTRRTRRKTCSSATSSTTNLTWSHPGLNSGLLSEKPASSSLNCGILITNGSTRLHCRQTVCKHVLSMRLRLWVIYLAEIGLFSFVNSFVSFGRSWKTASPVTYIIVVTVLMLRESGQDIERKSHSSQLAILGNFNDAFGSSYYAA